MLLSCLQETNLKDDQMTILDYIAYNTTGTIDDIDKAHAGVSISITESCRCKLTQTDDSCK